MPRRHRRADWTRGQKTDKRRSRPTSRATRREGYSRRRSPSCSCGTGWGAALAAGGLWTQQVVDVPQGQNADVFRSLALVAVMVITFGVANACTSGGHQGPAGGPPAEGRIVGRLLLEGGPTNTKQPVPGTVEYTVAKNHTGSTGTVQVGADGTFELSVSPGTYTLIGHSPTYNADTQEGVCGAARPVQVTSGQTVRADIYCQML
jgi:hypothetical protein